MEVEIDPKALTTPRDTCLEQWGEKFAWKKLIEEEIGKMVKELEANRKGNEEEL
mgnify:CR=1 FL=1